MIIQSSPAEIEIALLEDKRLVELNKEKTNTKFSVGDIYLGKVRKIMTSLNAAFVDVGYERDAFLHYLDLGPQFQSLNKFLNLHLSKRYQGIPVHKMKTEPDIDKHGKINDVLTVGQFIIVQIAKEPISTKGPRLTSEISIAGRNLVLMPFADKVSTSSRIDQAGERTRLKNLITSIKPKNYGVIVRTMAETKKVADLDQELRDLVKKWEGAFKKIREIRPPQILLGEMNRSSTIVRDMLNENFSEIKTNDEDLYKDLKEYIASIMPDKEKIVKHFTGKGKLFEKEGVNRQIKSLFGKTVPMRLGAYLIIEHTEALHVIDVNSGNRTKTADQESNALEVNQIAAEEIARQLRLRDMGGIIVVDFIDMQRHENKQLIFDKMKEFMGNDRTKHNILPLTKFGLMQITRQRVRPETDIKTDEVCPSCNGTGEITPSILITEKIENQISFLLEKYNGLKLTLVVHPYIEAYLKRGWLASIYWKWRRKHQFWMKIKPDTSYQYLEHHFFDNQDNEIKV